MQSNRVGALLPDNFGSFSIVNVRAASVGTTGNAVVTLPVQAGSSYIVRQVTIANASGSINTANVVILTSSDGNASNAITAVSVLSNITSTTTYQDLSLAAGAATTVYTAPALFLKVNTAVANATCDIQVYGDIVTP